ncbi:hypothetical protein SKAU_G00100460 [Synaphobranchus kaupii]|uniref:Uncharacterized protein n=1 Tax=Synaphobranchus kaupii TaxID=118154 RepID=A0A9Q1FZ96_SYNKA|nr:hypothetical protein SKAU_G00100460 [Synaphobranchus kaupii]
MRASDPTILYYPPATFRIGLMDTYSASNRHGGVAAVTPWVHQLANVQDTKSDTWAFRGGRDTVSPPLPSLLILWSWFRLTLAASHTTERGLRNIKKEMLSHHRV